MLDTHPCTPNQRPLLQPMTRHFPDLDGAWEDCHELAPGTTGLAFRVRIGDNAFVLKEAPGGVSDAALDFAFSLQESLHGSGFPCPRPLRTATGGWLAMEDGRRCTAQTFLPGQPPAPTGEHPEVLARARQMGSLIGNLHRLAATADLPPAPDDRHQEAHSALAHAQAGIELFFRGRPLRPGFRTRLRLRPRKSEMDRCVLRILPLMRRASEHLGLWIGEHRKALSELQPTHGDLNRENLLVDADGRIFLLDFDNARVQSRLMELGAAAAILSPEQDDAREAFLDAYAAEGFERTSSDMIRHLALLKYVRSLIWQIPRWYADRTQDARMGDWIIFLADHLERHWEQIRGK